MTVDLRRGIYTKYVFYLETSVVIVDNILYLQKGRPSDVQ